MAVQQLIWIVLIGAVLIAGFPVKSPDTVNEEDRLNYEKYVRQLEKKHKFAYNDIDQPWQSISDDDSAQDDSHEIVLKLEDSVSVQPLVKDEVKLTSQSPVVVADQAPVTPVIKVEDTPAVPATTAVVPIIKAEEAPAVAPVIEAEDTPAIPATQTEEALVVAPVNKAEEVPAVPALIKAEETPAVPAVIKAEETPVLAPVNEAVKEEQQVADAISESVAAVTEDEVATTTHEKLLSDIEDDVPATTTHDKLLGVADEVEGSGQSDAAAAEEESVTVSQANEPIEDSTFSALNTVEESATKVTDVSSDTNEGSGQPLSDSVTAADEGSGGQPLSDSANEGSGFQLLSDSDEGSGQPLIAENTSADEGSGAAADIAEGSGLADELIKEIDHTIQPEISNDESSTGTHSDLHVALAFDSLSTTAESLTTDLVDEKEVKSTDAPTADEAATTEIQPSPTIKSVQAEDSTEVVIADSTDVNDFRQVSAATSDSTDRPVEDTTFVNVPVNDEILADEAILKNTTEKPDDSHSTPSDV